MDAKQVKLVNLLVKQRGIYKATITRIQHFVGNEDLLQDSNNVRIKLEQLLETWTKYEEVQTNLELNVDNNEHDEERVNTETLVHNLRAIMETSLEKSREMAELRTSNRTVNTPQFDSTNRSNARLNLPSITLATFDGRYERWLSFSDTFKAMIHNNKDVVVIQKYYYLLSALSGQALQLIQNLPLTECNYAIAWKLLEDRYENKKLIASIHINELIEIKSVQKESATELLQFINTISSNLNAIKALNIDIPLDQVILLHLFTRRLDVNTRKEWELTLSESSFPSLNSFITFLEHRRQALENIKPVNKSHALETVSSEVKNKGYKHSRESISYMSTDTFTYKCHCCNGSHSLYKCNVFFNLSLAHKQECVQKNRLCFNCLRTGHAVKTCQSKGCQKCNMMHHTLLHKISQDNLMPSREDHPSHQSQGSIHGRNSPSTNKHQGSSNQTQGSYCTLKGRVQSHVLLSTSIVLVRDLNGKLHQCRALLDSGSQSNFCTEDFVQRLGLRKHKNLTSIRGINNVASESKHNVDFQLESRVSNFSAHVSCLVLQRITGNMPDSFIEHEHWNLPQDIKLADPTFFQPERIDLLLGAELFFQLLLPNRMSQTGNYPMLQDTVFGWILSGRFQQTCDYSSTASVTSHFLQTEDSLDRQLQRFWELEDINSHPKTKEEHECEKHFTKTITRDTTGRFVARLPFQPDHETLGNSFDQAKNRFERLESRLHRQPELRKEYVKFLDEYEALGHMKEVSADPVRDGTDVCYLPHHAVFKTSSTTTKTRVVFDASAKTTNGTSLNDILMVGPTIQQDLWSIVLRFRTYKIAFTADIAKMYRQVNVHPLDTRFQRILWRKSPEESLKCYELTTVTYGTASAPFLATRCLQQLAEEEEANDFPRAAEVLRRDFYVDDVLSGCDDIKEALQLQKELILLLSKGGFPLRKWSSNHPAMLEEIPPEYKETQFPLQLDHTQTVKTLGLLWNPTSDKFLIELENDRISNSSICVPNKSLTKRKISSVIASIFDPLGLVSPIVISYKMFLQQLWLRKLDWDDNLPSDLSEEWNRLQQQLPFVNNIQIDRLVLCKARSMDIQVHGFSDASERAYGACLYLRSVNDKQDVSVHLLCSKSKVAPVKKVTLPRLELCGALLLAQLIHKTLSVLNLKIDSIHLWTDSTIVLSWLASPPNRWETFVANRVSQIQEYTAVDDWKHVPSKHNPADLISRGVDAKSLAQTDIWWHGPEWLKNNNISWPSSVPILAKSDNPTTCEVVNVMLTTPTESSEILSRYSTLSKLTRVISYCMRFNYNSRNSTTRKSGVLSADELQSALNACIKSMQNTIFQREIQDLHNNAQVSKKSSILNLHPFLDNQELLRVGGRLNNSNLPYENKHPLILPPSHHLTKLIILAEHLRLLHAGPQLLVASLRQHYWIPRIKQVIKHVIHKCLPCFKLKASTSEQLMGQLPKSRVQPSRPFFNTGVDYAGPITIKSGSVRSKTTVKCYVAIFVCFTVKAVHLEPVSNLTSGAFIAALRRFTARRGKPTHIYSDNATNFVGANRELHELRRLFTSECFNKRIEDYAAKEQFTWHFIPPTSPHFGGLWEAAVKAMKFHLKRVVGTAKLTFEELTTLLSQIEACMNSRPITVLSNDPNEPSFLSPGHFLIGTPLVSLPEPDLTDVTLNYQSRWQRVQQIQQQWWKMWSRDYLNGLQQRQKWTSSQINIQPGVVVLVRDKTSSPLQWKLAIIENIFPGTDGLVRVVNIRLGKNTFKKSIHQLIPLPI